MMVSKKSLRILTDAGLAQSTGVRLLDQYSALRLFVSQPTNQASETISVHICMMFCIEKTVNPGNQMCRNTPLKP